jgi:hypothetical protein
MHMQKTLIERKSLQILLSHQVRLARAGPCVQCLPKLRDRRLVQVSFRWVNLFELAGVNVLHDNPP